MNPEVTPEGVGGGLRRALFCHPSRSRTGMPPRVGGGAAAVSRASSTPAWLPAGKTWASGGTDVRSAEERGRPRGHKMCIHPSAQTTVVASGRAWISGSCALAEKQKAPAEMPVSPQCLIDLARFWFGFFVLAARVCRCTRPHSKTQLEVGSAHSAHRQRPQPMLFISFCHPARQTATQHERPGWLKRQNAKECSSAQGSQSGAGQYGSCRGWTAT